MLVRSGQGDATSVLSLGAVAKGVFFSFAVTLLVALFLGIAVALTEWEGLSSGAHWFSYVSVALGGMLAAKHSRRYGGFMAPASGLPTLPSPPQLSSRTLSGRFSSRHRGW